jgi:hypothetical protein
VETLVGIMTVLRRLAGLTVRELEIVRLLDEVAVNARAISQAVRKSGPISRVELIAELIRPTVDGGYLSPVVSA